jgi:hypothetical protein
MTEPAKATIIVHWEGKNDPVPVPVQYNPTEYTVEKQAQYAEISIPGLDSPLQQYVRGQSEKLTLDLFFDTTDQGMGSTVTSVTTETDKIYQLLKIEPTRHAPPILEFLWSHEIPGSHVGDAPGSVAGSSTQTIGSTPGGVGSAVSSANAAAGSVGGSASTTAAGAAGVAHQRRNGFRCVLESVRQKFTLFSPAGVPLRATLTCTFREYKSLADQLAELHWSSPDRTHVHVLAEGEVLASVSERYYDTPGDWREIASKNGLEDPRRLTAGTFLQVPPLA